MEFKAENVSVKNRVKSIEQEFADFKERYFKLASEVIKAVSSVNSLGDILNVISLSDKYEQFLTEMKQNINVANAIKVSEAKALAEIDATSKQLLNLVDRMVEALNKGKLSNSSRSDSSCAESVDAGMRYNSLRSSSSSGMFSRRSSVSSLTGMRDLERLNESDAELSSSYSSKSF